MDIRTLGPDDLQAYMQHNNIPGDILHLGVPTPTVAAAAQAVGTAPDQIVKSILFLVDRHPVLAVTCGQMVVDQRVLAGLYQVGRKKVKLATPEQVLQETGFEVGAMPPFGHHTPLPTWMDVRLLAQSEVFAGGGAENALVKLKPDDILQATGAQVIDLLNKPAGKSQSETS